jgi:hypothetical protein
MKSFACYFDILGTKDLVSHNEFTDSHSRDFCGAVIVAANKFKTSRFAAFSDCVIFSTPVEKPYDLLNVLTVLCENWVSDGIFVRGGIALGEVRWVDSEIDKEIEHLKNLRCSRVYGSALNEAFEIEKSSGPGIIAFASDDVAETISKFDPSSVLSLPSNIIRNFEWKDLNSLISWIEEFCVHEESRKAQRHFNATNRALNLFRKQMPNISLK